MQQLQRTFSRGLPVEATAYFSSRRTPTSDVRVKSNTQKNTTTGDARAQEELLRRPPPVPTFHQHPQQYALSARHVPRTRNYTTDNGGGVANGAMRQNEKSDSSCPRQRGGGRFQSLAPSSVRSRQRINIRSHALDSYVTGNGTQMQHSTTDIDAKGRERETRMNLSITTPDTGRVFIPLATTTTTSISPITITAPTTASTASTGGIRTTTTATTTEEFSGGGEQQNQHQHQHQPDDTGKRVVACCAASGAASGILQQHEVAAPPTAPPMASPARHQMSNRITRRSTAPPQFFDDNGLRQPPTVAAPTRIPLQLRRLENGHSGGKDQRVGAPPFEMCKIHEYPETCTTEENEMQHTTTCSNGGTSLPMIDDSESSSIITSNTARAATATSTTRGASGMMMMMTTAGGETNRWESSNAASSSAACDGTHHQHRGGHMGQLPRRTRDIKRGAETSPTIETTSKVSPLTPSSRSASAHQYQNISTTPPPALNPSSSQSRGRRESDFASEFPGKTITTSTSRSTRLPSAESTSGSVAASGISAAAPLIPSVPRAVSNTAGRDGGGPLGSPNGEFVFMISGGNTARSQSEMSMEHGVTSGTPFSGPLATPSVCGFMHESDTNHHITTGNKNLITNEVSDHECRENLLKAAVNNNTPVTKGGDVQSPRAAHPHTPSTAGEVVERDNDNERDNETSDRRDKDETIQRFLTPRQHSVVTSTPTRRMGISNSNSRPRQRLLGSDGSVTSTTPEPTRGTSRATSNRTPSRGRTRQVEDVHNTTGSQQVARRVGDRNREAASLRRMAQNSRLPVEQTVLLSSMRPSLLTDPIVAMITAPTIQPVVAGDIHAPSPPAIINLGGPPNAVGPPSISTSYASSARPSPVPQREMSMSLVSPNEVPHSVVAPLSPPTIAPSSMSRPTPPPMSSSSSSRQVDNHTPQPPPVHEPPPPPPRIDQREEVTSGGWSDPPISLASLPILRASQLPSTTTALANMSLSARVPPLNTSIRASAPIDFESMATPTMLRGPNSVRSVESAVTRGVVASSRRAQLFPNPPADEDVRYVLMLLDSLFGITVDGNSESEETDEVKGGVIFADLPCERFDATRMQTLNTESRLCTICLEEFKHGQRQCWLPCAHTFHRRCVGKWLRRSSVCPICQIDVITLLCTVAKTASSKGRGPTANIEPFAVSRHGHPRIANANTRALADRAIRRERRHHTSFTPAPYPHRLLVQGTPTSTDGAGDPLSETQGSVGRIAPAPTTVRQPLPAPTLQPSTTPAIVALRSPEANCAVSSSSSTSRPSEPSRLNSPPAHQPLRPLTPQPRIQPPTPALTLGRPPLTAEVRDTRVAAPPPAHYFAPLPQAPPPPPPPPSTFNRSLRPPALPARSRPLPRLRPSTPDTLDGGHAVSRLLVPPQGGGGFHGSRHGGGGVSGSSFNRQAEFSNDTNRQIGGSRSRAPISLPHRLPPIPHLSARQSAIARGGGN